MQIAHIEGATRVIGKSQGYYGLPIRDELINCSVGGPDTPCMVTAWEPSADEIAALLSGAKIHVRILGTIHPPIMLMVGEQPDPVANPLAEYQPGKWYRAKTVDDMQAFYLSRLPAIRAAAREHGYAIGLHGSTQRDMDLIAMPWREEHADKDTLAHAIQNAACGITSSKYQWEQKPAGRWAASFPICWTDWHDMVSAGHIDLSVIPAAQAIGEVDALITVIGWLVEKYPTEQLLIQKLQVYLSHLEQAPQS